ncbi:hypothetical protein [Rossellomorea sp. KS-H15a]|uniref:hypothetical protein n=1 Tax=Rossellomorea sp. KS-H15a TaxID=2963940 RepID=UPI0020C6A4AC|nr:hypothetical protein [Rossellomorea sp. KS-H15a]UTE78474.1 hypothetical protein M1J35_06825 [Rossellomorea sp. KS-H15a]
MITILICQFDVSNHRMIAYTSLNKIVINDEQKDRLLELYDRMQDFVAGVNKRDDKSFDSTD